MRAFYCYSVESKRPLVPIFYRLRKKPCKLLDKMLPLIKLPDFHRRSGSFFICVRALLSMLELKTFSLLAVILNGPAGLDVVRWIRSRTPDVPLLRTSDEDFSLFGYRYQVTCFL